MTAMKMSSTCQKKPKIKKLRISTKKVTRAYSSSSSSLLEFQTDHANALDVVAALLRVFLVEWGPDFAKKKSFKSQTKSSSSVDVSKRRFRMRGRGQNSRRSSIRRIDLSTSSWIRDHPRTMDPSGAPSMGTISPSVKRRWKRSF